MGLRLSAVTYKEQLKVISDKADARLKKRLYSIIGKGSTQSRPRLTRTRRDPHVYHVLLIQWQPEGATERQWSSNDGKTQC